MSFRPRHFAAFTLIETMLAVLMMALLAAAVGMSFSGPLQSARAHDVIEQIASFDAASRQMAVAGGEAVRIQFDLYNGTLSRLEGIDLAELKAKATLPSGIRIDQVRIGGEMRSNGVATVDVSAHGWSRSYAVRVVGPGLDRWVCFAGMSGAMTEASDESSIPIPPRTPGYNAD